MRVRSELALGADGASRSEAQTALHWRYANEKQVDGNGGGRGAVALFNSPGFAGSVTQPGELVGLPLAPLSRRVLFHQHCGLGLQGYEPGPYLRHVDHPRPCLVDALDDLRRQAAILRGHRLRWSRASSDGGPYAPACTIRAFFGPACLGSRGGWGVSYGFGSPTSITPRCSPWSDTSLNQRVAVSYTGGGWNLTAHLIYGTHFDSVNRRPAILRAPARRRVNCNPDFINLDLTATKKFGKWELGPVAFASWDVSTRSTAIRAESMGRRRSRGYDFGPVNLQIYATTDVTPGQL